MTFRILRRLALPMLLVATGPALAQSGQDMSIDDMERALGLGEAAAPAAAPDRAQAPRFRAPSFSFGTPEPQAPASNLAVASTPSTAFAAVRPGAAPAAAAGDTGNSFWLPINFAFASAQILPGYAPAIARIAALLGKYPDLVLEIRGHTDAVGSASGNLSLSQTRADAVRDALVAQGVDPARLPTVGAGARQLLTGVAPASARNRRVEFKRIGG